MAFKFPEATTISLGHRILMAIPMDLRPQTGHRTKNTPPTTSVVSSPPQQFLIRKSATSSPPSSSRRHPSAIHTGTPEPSAPTPRPRTASCFFAVGKKSYAKVEAGSKSQPMLIFYTRGEGPAFSCSCTAYTHTPCAHTPKPSRFSPVFCRRVIAIFRQGFGRMAPMAKALQLPVEEQLHVAAMWNHMVHVRSPNPEPLGSTSPAPWLRQQLPGTPGLPSVAWVGVQVVPSGRSLAHLPWLVFWAIALRRKHTAARIPAFP